MAAPQRLHAEYTVLFCRCCFTSLLGVALTQHPPPKREGLHRTTPPMRSSTLLATSSSESGGPEGSNPQHLPPLAFLRPSTVFSSNDEPVFFHTGTAFRVQRTGTDSPENVSLAHAGPSRRSIPTLGCETHGRHERPRPLTWVATSDTTTIDLSAKPQPVMPVSTSHSPVSSRKTARGGGLIDELGGLWPN